MTFVPSDGLLVGQPEIDEVLDLDTGEILPAWKAVGDDYERVLGIGLRQTCAQRGIRYLLEEPLVWMVYASSTECVATRLWAHWGKQWKEQNLEITCE